MVFAEWKGPFEVVEQVSPVDYSIQTGNRTKKVFNINMLKEWVGRQEDGTAIVLTQKPNNVNVIEKSVPILCVRIPENEDIETESIENPLLIATENIDNVVSKIH